MSDKQYKLWYYDGRTWDHHDEGELTGRIKYIKDGSDVTIQYEARLPFYKRIPFRRKTHVEHKTVWMDQADIHIKPTEVIVECGHA